VGAAKRAGPSSPYCVGCSPRHGDARTWRFRPTTARRQLLYQDFVPKQRETRGGGEDAECGRWKDASQYISVREAHAACSAGTGSTCVPRGPSSPAQLRPRQWALHAACARITTFRELARYSSLLVGVGVRSRPKFRSL
jgi:hypothetical protein